MATHPETPSQTAGPYVHIGLIPRQAGFEIFERDLGAAPVPEGVPGERIAVGGRILDITGAPVRDALVEVWQADAAGHHANPAFRGFFRTGTDFATGLWRIETIRPGRVGQPRMAPHLNLWIAARGLNLGLATRLYFADEAEANAEDPVLALIDPPARRETLLAQRDADGLHCLDIRLAGEGETVFFDI